MSTINPNSKLVFGSSAAARKATDHIITTDMSLKSTGDYKTVVNIISQLIESGLTRMGEGYCISVSDIIYNLLTQKGIKCHLVECQLSIVNKTTNETSMIGFDISSAHNSHVKVNTHVVVMTDTEIPMIIDASIAHKLPTNMQVVIDKAFELGSKVFCKVETSAASMIYQEKKEGIGVPMLHQVSILDRISTDKKIFSEIRSLKYLNYIGIFLSAFAMINIITKFLTN